MKFTKKSKNTKGKKYQVGGNKTPEQEIVGKQLEMTPILPPESFQQIKLGDTQFRNATVTPTQQPATQRPDYNSMLTLGLGLTSAGLNFNQDIQNRRDLQESIQRRESDPLYDYNYMYGRTSTGGTEYQPIIKAQMGAQIPARYSSEGMMNNVEIEGGEFLQLPDMSTEIAKGPSHSKGGITTTLPEGTRVFSNHLTPMGSKKTFAKLAKKYDNSKYDEILNNKFSKQVDRDTALLMKNKNQKVLDQLFADQQMMNGNSNGEPMAKNGASIDNPGFRALPPAVQQKILSNMEYGGYSLPNPLYMQAGAQTPNVNELYPSEVRAALDILPSVPQNSILNPGFNVSAPQPTGLGYSANLDMSNITPGTQESSAEWTNDSTRWSKAVDHMLSDQNKINKLQNSTNLEQIPTESKIAAVQNPSTTQATSTTKKTSKRSVKPTLGDMMMEAGRSMTSTPTDAQMQEGVPYTMGLYDTSNTEAGAISPTGESVYAKSKSVEDYVAPWMDLIPNTLDMTEEQFQSKVYDYALENDPQSIVNMWSKFGITNKGKADKELMSLTKDGKFDAETLKDPKVLAKLKQAYVDGKLGARTLEPTKGSTPKGTGTPNEPDFGRELKTKEDSSTKPSTPDFKSVTGNDQGRYIKQAFPLDQAIPGIMGLAAAQETFGYGIPEVDAPYLRSQEMNIQSQLQNIDNMGDAAVRNGADPLATYIAGINAKQPVFERKQNFDAMGRSQADMFNAQAEMQKQRVNAAMFDRTYNQLYAQARDAGTAEKLAAVNNILEKKSKHDQSENLKQAYIDNLTSAYNVGDRGPGSFDVVQGARNLVNYGLPTDEAIQAAMQTSTAVNKGKKSNKTNKKK